MRVIKHISLSVIAFISVLYLGMASTMAHHSTAAFDGGKVVRIEGTITQFRWINPHASIKIDGVVDGVEGLWTIEMTAPNVLINQGWKRSSLVVGDTVVIYANPLRNAITLNDDSQGGLYVGAELADGSSLGQIDGTGTGSAR